MGQLVGWARGALMVACLLVGGEFASGSVVGDLEVLQQPIDGSLFAPTGHMQGMSRPFQGGLIGDPRSGPPQVFGRRGADRIVRLLGLDAERAEVVRALIAERQERFEVELLLVMERIGDLSSTPFDEPQSEARHMELQEALGRRAMLTGRIMEEAFEEIRLLLSDEELVHWPELMADRARESGLRGTATFYQEALDPIELVEAAGEDAQLTAGVDEVLRSYLLSVVPLIESRNGSCLQFESLHRMQSGYVEHSGDGAVDLDGQLEEAAERTWNTSLKIARLNVQTIQQVRGLLEPGLAARLDGVVLEFVDDYRGSFPGDLERETRVFLDESRFLRLLKVVGYARPGLFAAAPLSEDQRERLGVVVDRFEREVAVQLEGVREAAREAGLSSGRIGIATPQGAVFMSRKRSGPGWAEVQQMREQALESQERVDDAIAASRDIEQRSIDGLRSILTYEQRWMISMY